MNETKEHNIQAELELARLRSRERLRALALVLSVGYAWFCTIMSRSAPDQLLLVVCALQLADSWAEYKRAKRGAALVWAAAWALGAAFSVVRLTLHHVVGRF